jgi:hypothetical protein
MGSIKVTTEGTEVTESQGSDGEMSPEEAACWASAFEEFNSARKANGDAIAQLAVDNFHEVPPPSPFGLPQPPYADERSCGGSHLPLAEASRESDRESHESQIPLWVRHGLLRRLWRR